MVSGAKANVGSLLRGEDELLTVAEVAGRLLNQRTVRSSIDQGSLPVVRVGRRVSIERKDFDGLVEAR